VKGRVEGRVAGLGGRKGSRSWWIEGYQELVEGRMAGDSGRKGRRKDIRNWWKKEKQ